MLINDLSHVINSSVIFAQYCVVSVVSSCGNRKRTDISGVWQIDDLGNGLFYNLRMRSTNGVKFYQFVQYCIQNFEEFDVIVILTTKIYCFVNLILLLVLLDYTLKIWFVYVGLRAVEFFRRVDEKAKSRNFNWNDWNNWNLCRLSMKLTAVT